MRVILSFCLSRCQNYADSLGGSDDWRRRLLHLHLHGVPPHFGLLRELHLR